MAWPSPVIAGQPSTASQYNALLNAVQHWGGNVDAGGYAITNLAGFSVTGALAGNSVKAASADNSRSVTLNAPATGNESIATATTALGLPLRSYLLLPAGTDATTFLPNGAVCFQWDGANFTIRYKDGTGAIKTGKVACS